MGSDAMVMASIVCWIRHSLFFFFFLTFYCIFVYFVSVWWSEAQPRSCAVAVVVVVSNSNRARTAGVWARHQCSPVRIVLVSCTRARCGECVCTASHLPTAREEEEEEEEEENIHSRLTCGQFKLAAFKHPSSLLYKSIYILLLDASALRLIYKRHTNAHWFSFFLLQVYFIFIILFFRAAAEEESRWKTHHFRKKKLDKDKEEQRLCFLLRKKNKKKEHWFRRGRTDGFNESLGAQGCASCVELVLTLQTRHVRHLLGGCWSPQTTTTNWYDSKKTKQATSPKWFLPQEKEKSGRIIKTYSYSSE